MQRPMRRSRKAADKSRGSTTVRLLSDLLRSEPTPPASVVPFLLTVIFAVEASHSAGHGPSDLDPRKIVFQSDGSVSLLSRGTIGAQITVVLPSSKYSSPEIVEGISEGLDTGIPDSYVLGFVFYEILLGRNLLDKEFAEVERQGELGWLTWHMDLNRRAKSLSSLIPGFPESLSGLIDRMMAKSVADRVSSLSTIRDTLARSLEETTVLTNISSLLGEGHAGRKRTLLEEITAVWHELVPRMWVPGAVRLRVGKLRRTQKGNGG